MSDPAGVIHRCNSTTISVRILADMHKRLACCGFDYDSAKDSLQPKASLRLGQVVADWIAKALGENGLGPLRLREKKTVALTCPSAPFALMNSMRLRKRW